MLSILYHACLMLAAALRVCSQSIAIAAPPNNTVAGPGQNVTVELDFPNSLTGVQHISVVISLQSCAESGVCASPATDNMGTTLYAGNYTPTYLEADKPPYQNFTVTIPQALQSSSNLLNVAHFMLLGAGAQPILEFKNVSLIAETASLRRGYVRGRRGW